jgi:hypothetical protein
MSSRTSTVKPAARICSIYSFSVLSQIKIFISMLLAGWKLITETYPAMAGRSLFGSEDSHKNILLRA